MNSLLLAAFFIIAAIFFIYSIYFSNSTRLKFDQITLRNGPGLTYSKNGILKKNERLETIGKENGWIHLKSQDSKASGWTASWILKNGNKKIDKYGNISQATIVLDPGHGGSDPGSLAKANSRDPKNFEKTYTILTAKATKKALESTGARVIMTRNSDKLLWPLSKITNISKKYNADAFISFHFDNFEIQGVANGFTTYYDNGKNSFQLAKTINSSFNDLPLQNRGVEVGDYYVLRETTLPSVLLEMGYMNNPDDFKIIREKSYRKKIAADLKTSLVNWFNESNQ